MTTLEGITGDPTSGAVDTTVEPPSTDSLDGSLKVWDADLGGYVNSNTLLVGKTIDGGTDLTLGDHAYEEIFPLILDWILAYDEVSE